MRSTRADSFNVSYETKEVQVDPLGQNMTFAELSHADRDEVVPWGSPSLVAPLCSWSAFPLEPSAGLKQLVEFFSPVQPTVFRKRIGI
jgi:hypothetical protein